MNFFQNNLAFILIAVSDFKKDLQLNKQLVSRESKSVAS